MYKVVFLVECFISLKTVMYMILMQRFSLAKEPLTKPY